MCRPAFALLWVFVFVIPWEEAVRFPGFGSLGRVVGMAAFLVGAFHVLIRRGIRPLGWYHVFALLFVLWAGIGLSWSLDRAATGTRFQTYAQLGLFVWLIWEVAWSQERQRALLQAYVLGAYVLAISTIHSRLTGGSLLTEDARFAGLGYNPNDLALTMVLGLPMAWYLTLSPSRLVWLNRLYLPLAIAAVLLTASRGAVLTAVPALLIIPWTLTRVRLRRRAVLSVLALGSLFFLNSVVPEASWQRVQTTRTDLAQGHFGGRGEIWQAGAKVFLQHPLVGVGAGAFPVAVEPLVGPRASHQTFLSVLVEQGLIGFTLFIGMFVAGFLPLRRFPALERKFWVVMLLTLSVALLPANWDYRKPPWFLLGVLAAQAAVIGRRRAATSGRVRSAGRGIQLPTHHSAPSGGASASGALLIMRSGEGHT